MGASVGFAVSSPQIKGESFQPQTRLSHSFHTFLKARPLHCGSWVVLDTLRSPQPLPRSRAGRQRRGGPSGEPGATLKMAAGGSQAGRRAQDGGTARPAFPRPTGGDFRRERERASVPW